MVLNDFSPVQFHERHTAMGDATMRSPSSASRNSASSSLSKASSSVAAIKFAKQADKLSHLSSDSDGSNAGSAAIRAEFITPQDPIIVTADGGRLPEVPLAEAHKLNQLRDEIDVEDPGVVEEASQNEKLDESMESSTHSSPDAPKGETVQKSGEGSLRRAMPPSRTNPLFPPLPLYGPPSLLRDLQCMTFRVTSAFLSFAFLAVIVLGSAFTAIPLMFTHIWLRLTFRHPDNRRPFIEEERRRQKIRREKEQAWRKKLSRWNSDTNLGEDNEDDAGEEDGFIPTEGGPDPLVCDIGYYARRVGLDVEEFKVQTEDGFILTLWHVYDPREFTPLTPEQRQMRGPDLFTGAGPSRPFENSTDDPNTKRKFPVLMIHGLLQSAGAYCTNDDSSLAFYLCKSGYDVWLGNNRCGFHPEHTLLKYSDPRMWAWNIRQMGVLDLPAFVSRVLSETGFEKLGLICHSQGTTETFVALAKEQRPDLGDKITVFCALAPAAYAGPLIGKMYFKFMRVISPAFFRIFFGIHAFIPFMMTMHATLPGRLYGALGYRVFSFLFNWTDARWELALRDRMFRFAPVYVSAESMRWWLGRECFAKQKCILQTREEWRQEDVEDEMEEYYKKSEKDNKEGDVTRKSKSSDKGEASASSNNQTKVQNRAAPNGTANNSSEKIAGRPSAEVSSKHRKRPKGSTAWYDSHVPPFALWVCGSDDLVDGRRLLRRFERGREPHVRVVHSKIIEEYEHLDVIWAVDVIEQVGKEIKEVLWRTCDVRERVRVPRGCEEVGVWVDTRKKEEEKGKGEEGKEVEGGGEEEDEEEESSSSDEDELAERASIMSEMRRGRKA